MKLILLITTIIFSVDALGATTDTLTHKPTQSIPIRRFYRDGNPIPIQDVWLIHRKDEEEFGWKFNNIEFLKMIHGQMIPPAYDFDPVHGSNGGVSIC